MTDPKPALDDVDAELALVEARALADQLPVADGLDTIRRRTR
ncbi:hypothetical protein SAMN05216275_14124 [Streptosporangium canum]|uniref:Uncharacterized protein n=1 Tax=Streptosporangium canum TaxID=324952 RepID=A0A1I4DGE2_9ACTN|nr:hypothetical protein [Streptosporangium canum]SFK91860.1 hypothetical protein SAMN05216275_14124 [Streptosporangium canum]